MSDQISISAEDFIPIKATPDNMRPLMRRRLEERVDHLNAQHRQKIVKPPKYQSEDEYRKAVLPVTKLKDGTIVSGKVSDEEVHAMQSGDEVLFRKVARLRAKAHKMAMDRRMEGKTSRDYYQSQRKSQGYEGLSRRQDHLPNSPYKNRNDYLEY